MFFFFPLFFKKIKILCFGLPLARQHCFNRTGDPLITEVEGSCPYDFCHCFVQHVKPRTNGRARM